MGVEPSLEEVNYGLPSKLIGTTVELSQDFYRTVAEILKLLPDKGYRYFLKWIHAFVSQETAAEELSFFEIT